MLAGRQATSHVTVGTTMDEITTTVTAATIIIIITITVTIAPTINAARLTHPTEEKTR